MIRKAKKFVRDHEDAIVVSVVATSVMALTTLSYILGKNQGTAEMRVEEVNFYNDDPETGEPQILGITHTNGKITRLKRTTK